MKRKDLKISQTVLFVYKSSKVQLAMADTDPTTTVITITVTGSFKK